MHIISAGCSNWRLPVLRRAAGGRLDPGPRMASLCVHSQAVVPALEDRANVFFDVGWS